MNNKTHVLSGEQALNDYFTSLLDEEELNEAFNTPSKVELSAVESTVSAEEMVPKLQPDYHSSYTELEYNEFEVPDLEDVQKLLDKLETTDLAAEPDIATIIERNNGEIAEVTRVESVVEEIQEWDVATEVEQVVAESPAIEEFEVPEPVIAEPEVVEEVEIEQETEVELQTETGGAHIQDWQSIARNEDFQVLYFDVNGVTFAVPLDELGGIHRRGEMSHLIGRPGWYLGLQTNKNDQLDVVDTAKWVMSDRLTDDSHKEHYQYVVMLGESNWGLASTELKGTELLNTEKVRWRELSGKRPWLAGMVKEKMCALIHVEAMITMLNAGLDVKSLDS